MENLIYTLKAVSDLTRARIIMALSKYDELCVCRITEMLELAPSTVSKHISMLKHAGLAKSRKEGKWIYFSLNKNSNKPVCASLIKILTDNLKDNSTIKSDEERLGKILKSCGEEKCFKTK